MTSDSAKNALSLVDKTEANIKPIGQISSSLANPILNGWRYAPRHVLAAFVGGCRLDENARKTVNNLKRAYFDSCDIVLNYQLHTLRKIYECCLGYAEVVVKVISDYPAWLEMVRDAQRRHREAQTAYGDARETASDSLAPSIKVPDGILDKLSFHAEEIAPAFGCGLMAYKCKSLKSG